MIKFIKNIKNLYIIFLAAVIISIVTFAVQRIESDADYGFDDDSIYDWSDGWKVNVGSSVGADIELPAVIDNNEGKSVILKKKLPNKIKKYNCLVLESNRNDVMVHVAGVLRNSYQDNQNKMFKGSKPSSVVLIPLYSTDADADVSILYTSDRSYLGEIGRIYLGNDMSIILSLIKGNIFWVFLMLIIVIVGVICFVGYLTYRHTFGDGSALIHLFFFSILISVYCFTESGIRQVFIKDIALCEELGYSFIMLAGMTVISYANSITQSRHKLYFRIGAIALILNFALQYALRFMDRYEFFEMKSATGMISVLCLVVVIDRCIKDIRDGRSGEVLFLLASVVCLLIATAADIYGVRFVSGVSSNCILIGGLAFLMINGVYTVLSAAREQRLKKDAENANIAKSQFLATMSHEIRTPINAVLGMNEIILRDSKEAEIKNYAGRIADAGKTLLSLVNDILDFSKIESGKMDINCTEYQTKTLFYDLVLMLDTRIRKKNIQLVLDIDESIPAKLFGDEIRVKQVITNLLTNAAKYTEEGSIIFTVRQTKQSADEIELFVSVKDTGMGIKKEDVGKLMDSFVRVDVVKNKSIEGTGLGLSITKQLLTLMNSSLSISSEYGVGSEFSFTLRQKIIDAAPMGAVKIGEFVHSEHRGISFMAPDAKILAVDDNPTNLVVVKGLLKPSRMQIEICGSGAECIRLCREKRFDLILMDHMMPEMDGIETLEHLRTDGDSLCAKTPVIALTANAISGAAEMYKEKGFNDYLTKPIDILLLDDCCKKMLPSSLIKEFSEEDFESMADKAQQDDSNNAPLTTDLINGEAAMEYSGGDYDSYIDILKSYYKQGVKTLSARDNDENHLYGDADIKEFTVKVHSLKSSSKTIGALMLSEMALKLEEAGNEGNTAFINEYELPCRRLYDEVLKQIGKYLEEKGVITKTPAEPNASAEGSSISSSDIGALKVQLEEVKDAIDDFDYDNAMELLEGILEKM